MNIRLMVKGMGLLSMMGLLVLGISSGLALAGNPHVAVGTVFGFWVPVSLRLRRVLVGGSAVLRQLRLAVRFLHAMC